MLAKFIDTERVIHSIKTAIACVFGYLLSKALGFQGQWTVITIIVVLCAQIYVGGVVQKAYFRFLGTVVGCLFATIALLTVQHDPLSVSVTLAISTLVFSFFAVGYENLSQAGTLGAATTAIIMINPNPTLQMAGERFLEISVGILIATVISQVVLPIHARSHLRRTQAKTLTSLREFYQQCMMMAHQTEINFEDADENISKLLIKQRQLAKESVREPFGIEFNPGIFLQSLYCEKQILRAINSMHHILHENPVLQKVITESNLFQTLNDAILQMFDHLIRAADEGKTFSKSLGVPTFLQLKNELDNKLTSFNEHELMLVNALLFSAENLTRELQKLTTLINR